MAIDIYAAMGRKKKKSTVDINAVMGRTNNVSVTPQTSTTKTTASADNLLSLDWKNKITDIDSEIKKLESTDINSLPANNRASAVENIQTQLDTLRSTKKTYEIEYNNALKYGDKLLEWYSLPARSDYAQKSQYVSTKENLSDEQLKAQGYKKTTDGKSWVKGTLFSYPRYYDGGGDTKYEYINDSSIRETVRANELFESAETPDMKERVMIN